MKYLLQDETDDVGKLNNINAVLTYNPAVIRDSYHSYLIENIYRDHHVYSVGVAGHLDHPLHLPDVHPLHLYAGPYIQWMCV